MNLAVSLQHGNHRDGPIESPADVIVSLPVSLAALLNQRLSLLRSCRTVLLCASLTLRRRSRRLRHRPTPWLNRNAFARPRAIVIASPVTDTR